MQFNFSSFKKNSVSVLDKIHKLADKKGVSAYLVGGIVRDLLLKRPNLDLDIVLEGDAVRFAHELLKDLPQDKKTAPQLITYNQFGTATLDFSKFSIDFATARKESYPYPGALPIVEQGTIQDDLFRRDFTVNAMAIAIHKDQFGQLVDYYGGLDDLKNKKIRILHDKSFLDDPTRILRAVRFEQRLNFRIEQKTLALLKSALSQGYVETVKSARYFAEFIKILNEPFVRKYIQRLSELKGLNFLGRNFSLNVKLVSLLEQNRKVLPKNNYCFDDQQWLVYLMSFVDWRYWEGLEDKLKQFNLNKSNRKAVLESQNASQFIKKLQRINLAKNKIYRILKPLSYSVIVYMRLTTQSKLVRRRIDGFITKYSLITLSIDGNDLKRLGIAEDQKMGCILDILLNRKINGQIKTRSEELKEARRLQRKSMNELMAERNS